jgi:hypothetical protein
MLIYASSCKGYFSEHGEAFIRSAEKCGHKVKIDMAEDFPDWREKLHCDSDRTFSCWLRLLRLPEMLDQEDVLVLDIDSIINKPIKLDCDLALFLRPWIAPWRESLQVLMTASYWNKSAKPFAERVREKLLSQFNQWGDDQAAIWKIYQEMGDQFDIVKLDQDFVCYNFDRDAPIWTCKGPARKNNPSYLERRAAYA